MAQLGYVSNWGETSSVTNRGDGVRMLLVHILQL